MRVLLRPEVFAGDYRMELLVLLWLGSIGRHRVVPDPLDAPECERWVSSLDPSTRRMWQAMVEGVLQREQFEPARYEVALTSGREVSWRSATPALPVNFALDLLVQPYRFILENNVNDRAFVLALSGYEARRVLEDAERRSWLVFEMGGGSMIVPRINEVRRSEWLRRTSSVLIDSDAMRPPRPGEKQTDVDGLQARAARKQAAEGGVDTVDLHVLRRRSIENYLPLTALDRWASGSPTRRRMVKAFRRLSEAQRHHYGMKSGFNGDAAEAQRAGELYAGVPSRVHDTLATGFGSDIAALFAGAVLDSDEDVSGREEVRVFVSEVIARMR